MASKFCWENSAGYKSPNWVPLALRTLRMMKRCPTGSRLVASIAPIILNSFCARCDKPYTGIKQPSGAGLCPSTLDVVVGSVWSEHRWVPLVSSCLQTFASAIDFSKQIAPITATSALVPNAVPSPSPRSQKGLDHVRVFRTPFSTRLEEQKKS